MSGLWDDIDINEKKKEKRKQTCKSSVNDHLKCTKAMYMRKWLLVYLLHVFQDLYD